MNNEDMAGPRTDDGKPGAETLAQRLTPVVNLRNLDDSVLGLQVLAITSDCVKLIDIEGRLRYMNDSGRLLMDVEDFAAMDGSHYLDIWPHATRETVKLALEDARSGKTARFSEFCPTAKGTARWWDVVVSPVRSATGEIVYLLAVSRDITQQRQVEHRLRTSEQRFRALADNIAQLAWMADASGNIFWYNQRWFQYTGTTHEEMAGWAWRKVHHPDHVERVVEKLKRHFKSGEAWEDTFPLRGADGRYRWFLSRAMPIKNDRDATDFWCGTNTDITDQLSTAERLRQKARLIEQSHEAIFVWTLRGEIVTWNRGCRELYGYSSDEAIGRQSHDLLKTGHAVPTDVFESMLTREGKWSGELKHIAKDGSEVWVESRQEVIEVGGRPLVLETDRDVTARRQYDQMTQLLMAELDHRVKNTLAIVQSIASQTARRAANVNAFTGSFNARLQSLASAHNLLTASRWSGADLTELIRSQLIDTPDDETTVVVDGPAVWLSPQISLQLALIIYELASNARKYGSLSVPDGQVSISWRLGRNTSGQAQLDLLWREVGGPLVTQPTGRGFGTTLIDRAAGQAHLRATLAFNPTGLECHVLADVQTGQTPAGQYFNPQVTGVVAPAPSNKIRPASGGNAPRILVVEDEPLIAMEIDEVLSSHGFATLGPVSSIADALIAIDKDLPDLAVIDGSLFGHPVDAIALRLSEKHIPFVVVTGFAQETLSPAIDVTRVPVMRKPVPPHELIAAVRTLVANAKPRD